MQFKLKIAMTIGVELYHATLITELTVDNQKFGTFTIVQLIAYLLQMIMVHKVNLDKASRVV